MGLIKSPREYWQAYQRLVVPRLAAQRHARELVPVFDHTDKIAANSLLLFSTLRNEAVRIPYFLEYHRKLGIDHFLFVDNGSTDGFAEMMRGEGDCSVWRTEASYKQSNFGMHWLNHLLSRFGSGKWCLTCDPDELLVYPHCESRKLQDLVDFLESEKRDHLFCLMLDMYGDGPIENAVCRPGQAPLDVAPYFDGLGFVQRTKTFNGDVHIQGGVRRRVFFTYTPQNSPALNKTPLIKWRSYYSYLSSMHVAAPKRLNRPHEKDCVNPTGCVLHFKFLSTFTGKAEEEMQRQQHYADSVEYRRYQQWLKSGGGGLKGDISVKYESSRQLIDLGLMNSGQWF
jgi:hypothetical protein